MAYIRIRHGQRNGLNMGASNSTGRYSGKISNLCEHQWISMDWKPPETHSPDAPCIEYLPIQSYTFTSKMTQCYVGFSIPVPWFASGWLHGASRTVLFQDGFPDELFYLVPRIGVSLAPVRVLTEFTVFTG